MRTHNAWTSGHTNTGPFEASTETAGSSASRGVYGNSQDPVPVDSDGAMRTV